ncbi:MAG: hypothetical protein DMG09_14365 [Acidobacteria bacterium]|nr:MAG: hypothetical protein DMG09_14365 [Acidobacteriota bacterium]
MAGESAYSNQVSKAVPTATCTYSISPASQSAASGGGAGSVSVTAPAGCAWTAASNAGWITVTSGSSGSGNGTVNYSVQANTGTSSRTGTLTVAGQTATIAQAGAPSTASADVTLAWDRSADSTVVSYKLYYGVASGTYQTSLSCGNNTSYTVTGLGAGTYYFAVTAGDSSGNESGYSNEVSRTITGCAYSISPLSQSSASAGGAGSVAVTALAGCPWTAASGVSWITITSGSGGTGNGTVNYSVDANTISTARIGTMTIAGLTFTVTQSGTSCGYSVSPVSASASASAGTGTVSVATSGTCSWNAASNAGWIVITSGNGGAGNGSVNYSVQANTGTNPRTGTLTVAGQTVTITQAAAPCTFSASPTSQSLSSSGGALAVTVTTGSTCAWTAASNVGWITLASGIPVTGSGTAGFSVADNSGGVSRTGTVTVAGQTVTVTQTGGTSCGFAISPASKTFDGTAATGSVSITSPGSCSWTASSSSSWITVTSAASGAGNATVTYSITQNTNSSARSGKMTIAGQTFWVAQSSDQCNFSLTPASTSFDNAGGSGKVALTGPNGCSWKASSTESWISISSRTKGHGDGTVGYSVQSNTAGGSRVGLLILGGDIFTVNQGVSGQTFFPQFSAGAQWESELVMTNPSSSETATGSVTVLNDGGEQIGDSGSRSFTIEPLGSARFAMDGSGDLVSGSARVKANIPVAGVAKYRHPALGMAVVGNSAPARSVMAAVVRDKDRGLNTGIAVSNALDRAVEVKLSLRGHDGREAAGGSASYTLPASGHVAKLMDQWFPEAETSGFQGTVVVSTEQTEESITAAAMQIGTSVGELTSLPVVAVDPARAGRELYFAHFAKGTGWDTALFLTNPTGSMTASEVVFYDDAGNLISPSANGQMSAGALASLQPQGGAVIAADGSGELLSGSARVVADNALGGFLRFSAPGLGMAGAEASEPMEGFIAPMSRHAGQSTSTGVAIASIGNPVALSLTLRDENGKPVVGGEAVLELRANGHVSRLLEQLFPEADTHNFKGTLTVKAAGGKIVGTVIEIGLQPGQFTALPVAELR